MYKSCTARSIGKVKVENNRDIFSKIPAGIDVYVPEQVARLYALSLLGSKTVSERPLQETLDHVYSCHISPWHIKIAEKAPHPF